MPAPLLTIRDLHIAFTSDKKEVPAVNGVDLTIYAGQTVAIVGESGSGKSTTAHAIIDLLPVPDMLPRAPSSSRVRI